MFYQWEPTVVFDLKGPEMENLLRYINYKLNNDAAREVISLYEIKKALDEKIIEGLKTGKVIVQQVEEEKS
jgi:hypothetical protein